MGLAKNGGAGRGIVLELGAVTSKKGFMHTSILAVAGNRREGFAIKLDHGPFARTRQRIVPAGKLFAILRSTAWILHQPRADRNAGLDPTRKTGRRRQFG